MDLESHTHEPLHESHRKSHRNQSSRFVLLAVPFLIILLLITVAVSLGSKKRTMQDFPAEEAGQFVGETIAIQSFEDYARYAPTNPTGVRAYADSSKRTSLVSGRSYRDSSPYFEWFGAQSNEQGASIVGYNVFFGQNYPSKAFTKSQIFFVTTPSFSPKAHGISLQSGKTYELWVQAVSNGSAAKWGFDRTLNLPGSKLFTYPYTTVLGR